MRCFVLFALFLLSISAHAAVGNIDVNGPEYPDSSLADFSFLVPAPAGRHGFLTTHPDGHFYFADGTRARFWGINVSSASIPQTNAVIDATVARFRRAGINMLRLEAADNVGMLLDTDDKTTSRRMRADYLQRMHRWMAAAKKNGLYIYLQLLDFRTFHVGDGVPNGEALGRAAKPYAFFDPKLIELQKEFARQILETENPYTHTRPIDDPSVAVIELANEHGLFIKGDTWRKLVPPYDQEFQKLWNDWLRNKYGTTAALDKAWTSPDGKHALHADESLEQGTVQLPDMSDMDRVERAKTDWTDVARSPARVDDGARFAYDLQRSYFRDMKSYLVSLGVKIPVTAVVSAWIAPDVKSVADELDFTAENWYWDHPAFEPNKEWQRPFYYANKDPLANTGAWNAAPYMAFMKWKGKPVIIREWAAVWPNQYRASSVPLAAAYAAYQDLDGMLAFGYQFTGKGKLGDFNFERDPVRWGLMGLGALLFLRGDVQPSDTLVELSYSDPALFTYRDYLNSLYRLAFGARVESVAADQAGKSGAALVLDAQPDSPPAALADAIVKLRSDNRLLGDDLAKVSVSQDGQILYLDTVQGAFGVKSDRTIIVAGQLGSPLPTFPDFLSSTPYGCLWMSSLDGQPLGQSGHYLIKMVSVAKNTGEQFEPSSGKYYPGKFALKSLGDVPVVTLGHIADVPTRLAAVAGTKDHPLVVDMQNGTWELERFGRKGRFACDTPDIPVTIPGLVSATAVLASGEAQPLPLVNGVFTYPKGAARVDLAF